MAVTTLPKISTEMVTRLQALFPEGMAPSVEVIRHRLEEHVRTKPEVLAQIRQCRENLPSLSAAEVQAWRRCGYQSIA